MDRVLLVRVCRPLGHGCHRGAWAVRIGGVWHRGNGLSSDHPDRCRAGSPETGQKCRGVHTSGRLPWAGAHPTDPPRARSQGQFSPTPGSEGAETATADGGPSPSRGRRAHGGRFSWRGGSAELARSGSGSDPRVPQDLAGADRGSPTAVGEPALIAGFRGRLPPDPAPPESLLRIACVVGRCRPIRREARGCLRARGRT